MRNIDAKAEGIGFLIAKNEGELENLRIPVGGIVKLQDSGKKLERTASGFVEYSGGGGGGSSEERLQGYYDGSAWVQTDEEKALNAQLYTKIVSAIENDKPMSVRGNVNVHGTLYRLTSIAISTIGSMVGIVFVFDTLYAFVLSSDGSVSYDG